MSAARRVAVLWALLDRVAVLPFDEHGAADRVYRRIETALASSLVAYAEYLIEPWDLAA